MGVYQRRPALESQPVMAVDKRRPPRALVSPIESSEQAPIFGEETQPARCERTREITLLSSDYMVEQNKLPRSADYHEGAICWLRRKSERGNNPNDGLNPPPGFVPAAPSNT